MVILMFGVSDHIIENGPGTPVMPTDIYAADDSILSDSSLFGFCSLSRTVSARCRNAVSNPNKAVVTIDSVTAEVMTLTDVMSAALLGSLCPRMVECQLHLIPQAEIVDEDRTRHYNDSCHTNMKSVVNVCSYYRKTFASNSSLCSRHVKQKDEENNLPP